MTRPQRSNKYRAYRRSKYTYPTSIIKGAGSANGHLVIGAEKAESNVRAQIGRDFKEGTITAHTRSQWVWKEPK